MASAMKTMADIGEKEYRAAQSENPSDMKALYQHIWVLPYKNESKIVSGLNWDVILGKVVSVPRGIVPENCGKTVVTIDLGLHVCWWAAVAFTLDAQAHVVDYGNIDVPQGQKTEVAQILIALREFRDSVLAEGWGGSPPDVVLVDSGGGTGAGERFSDAAYRFCNESGPCYLPSKGLGTARNQDSWKQPKPARGRIIGRDWVVAAVADGVRLVEMHTDFWKREVHAGFAAPAGVPGSITLFSAEKRDHWTFCRHITSERQEDEFEPGKGIRVYWRQYARSNHWFDVMYAALVGASLLGIRAGEAEPDAVNPTHGESEYSERKDGAYQSKAKQGWRIGR